ncbi:MAG: AAA family ATPase [Blautia sp.]|nr:AAA family ATPase [Blautia sp.]
MLKKIFLGTDHFDKLIDSGGYYVDKTELLYELVEETSNEITLFTRPRRFGKSLTLSMMESFFDCGVSGERNSRDKFKEWAIYQKHPDFCENWMNRYPTIFISLKDVEGLTFEDAYEMLVGEIAKLCIRKAYLEKEEKVTAADSVVFRKLMFKEASKEEIKNSLQTIMRMMCAVYQTPVILLIDEYDVPLAKAQENHYYYKMLDVIRGIMSISLKSNEYLKFAVVTGCLRIPKESIFTGVNNFASYSVLDEDFSEYFGFTYDEVKCLLKYYDREEMIDMIRTWYDGYIFGDTNIFCPWDVLSYVAALRKRSSAVPKAYWENTSGNGAIREFFKLGNEDITDQLEALLNGGTVTENVTNALTYEEAYTSANNLWSVLLMTGYVTAVSQEEAGSSEEGARGVELRIPNREILTIFQKAVADHFSQTVDQERIKELIDALWDKREDRATELLSDLLFETISYMDYHEDYYQAFIAGIFAGRGYVPQSNKEHGLGRPDVYLRDRRNRRMMIIECKKSDSKNRMDYWCDNALKQIVEKKYAVKTEGFDIVLCYGISFFEKRAKVKLLR